MKDYEEQDQVRTLLMRSRELRGKTQKDMAKLLEISENTVYNWENGISNPSYINVKKWLDVLGINISINDPLTDEVDYCEPEEEPARPPYDHIALQKDEDNYRVYYYFGEDRKSNESMLMKALLEHYRTLFSEIDNEGSET